MSSNENNKDIKNVEINIWTDKFDNDHTYAAIMKSVYKSIYYGDGFRANINICCGNTSLELKKNTHTPEEFNKLIDNLSS